MRNPPPIGARVAACAFVALAALAALATPASAQLTLQNDSFTSGQTVGVQGGFVTGEIGASRFVAPAAGRQLLGVQVLFGGGSGTRDVTLRVWDDSAGTLTPGTMLFEGDFTLTASDQNLSMIDLSAMNVLVTQQFRVGIVFQHNGLPSIARDDDGTNTAGRNFIYADLGQWFASSTLGVPGDWIIRAVVSNPSPPGDAGMPDAPMPPGDAGVPDGATPPVDAAPPGPDAATGTCSGNGDCMVGSYCDPQSRSCTFDCRTDDDCGGDHCNTLGQCIEGSSSEPGGCCSTTADPRVALALGGVVALVLGRRRRRR